MHPRVDQAEPWPEWITEAARQLTGYTLLSCIGLESTVVVDDEYGLIEVLPSLNTEQLLGAVIVAAVYVLTGRQSTDLSEHAGQILPFPGNHHN
jgi:hypothetical protein